MAAANQKLGLFVGHEQQYFMLHPLAAATL